MIVISEELEPSRWAALRSRFWKDQIAKGAYDHPDYDHDDFELECEKLLRSRWNRVLSATIGESPVGYLYGNTILVPSSQSEAKVFRINEIYVMDAYRRTEVASELLKSLVDGLRSHGTQEIELNVLERNIEGIRFWERHGFKVTFRTLRRKC